MDWLRKIRQEKNFTQEKASSLAGLDRGYYSMIEIGIRRPSVEVAKKIASALDFDWTRFYEDESEKEVTQ